MSGLAAFVVKPPPSGELGTSIGTQEVVYTSSSSPLVHAASGVDITAFGVVVTVSSGAPTIASASTAAGNSRRAGIEWFAMGTSPHLCIATHLVLAVSILPCPA